MNKTDRPKIICIGICIFSLVLFSLGFREIGALLTFPAILVIGFAPNKSGVLFSFSIFLAMLTCGFLTDYPYENFPAATIALPLIPLILHIRTWFFKQLAIYKWPKFELIALNLAALLFFSGAFLSHYKWWQWISGGLPAALYVFFSVVIFKDRDDARKLVEGASSHIGKMAPHFTLPDQNGNPVSLKDILSENHALLIFVRGDWCPTCHMMMRGYLRNKEKFASKNVKVIGIGPDPIGVNRDLINKIDAGSLMLSDEEQNTAASYSGAIQANNPVTKNLYKQGIPLPASFLVHKNGKIIFSSRSDKAAEILEPEKIFEVLESI